MKAYDKTCPKCSGQMEIDYLRAMLVCPYCGNEMILEPEMMQAPIEPPKAAEPEKKTIFSTLSLVFGIASLLTCFLIIPDIAAIVFGILSLIKEKDSKCFAKSVIGIVLGLTALGIGLIVIFNYDSVE